MKKIIRSLRMLFGFTKSGSSRLGVHALAVLGEHTTHQGVGISLIGLVTAVILVHNLSNIGGSALLSINNDPGVKLVSDATTQITLQNPLSIYSESRGISWFHAGVDLAAPTGTPTKPILTGIVKEVNHWVWGYGIHVIIEHSDGLESIYGHLSKTNVEAGQKVQLDTIIGEVGSTGFSTGPHLHLEIHQNGQLINPADIVPGVK